IRRARRAGTSASSAVSRTPARRARLIATTHQVWVAMAAFAADTGEGYAPAGGRSGIWRPDGSPAARAGAAVGEVVSAPMTA
ncbi:MAG: carbon-nitrogen hydrolase family protein, partial [Actinomycetota bacterium]